MANVVSQRFVLVVNKLIKDSTVKSARKLSQSLDYLPQSLSEVVKGKRDITINQQVC